MTPNSTCRFLSNGYKFTIAPDNNVTSSPCCWWAGPTVSLGSPKHHYQIHKQSIGHLDSYQTPYCSHCNMLESKGIIKNLRQSSFHDVPEDAEFGDPSFLEIQLDRTCNAACIMCSPQYSTLWQQELRNAGQQIISNSKIDYIRALLFAVDIQKARKINFLGGESFLLDYDTRILSQIKNPELVVLQYSTNGSIYPTQDRQNLWKSFKRVNVSYSLDGIGPQFEYIRYPLNWQQVKNNFVRALESMPPNVNISICHTVNIFNLYYYAEFEQWTKQFNIPAKHFTFNPAEGIFNPHSVPKKLYDKIVKKYPEDHIVRRTVTNTDADLSGMLNHIAEIDQRRGLDWRCVFPEIADCFD